MCFGSFTNIQSGFYKYAIDYNLKNSVIEIQNINMLLLLALSLQYIVIYSIVYIV